MLAARARVPMSLSGALLRIPANLWLSSHIPRIHVLLKDPVSNPEMKRIEGVVSVGLTAVGRCPPADRLYCSVFYGISVTSCTK